MNTEEKSCTACDTETEKLGELHALEYLKHISNWMILEKTEGIAQLTKSFAFNHFTQGLLFANRVGELAETENHHPSILIEWGSVTLYWWTHRLKGLTKLDFEMAATCDLIFNEIQLVLAPSS